MSIETRDPEVTIEAPERPGRGRAGQDRARSASRLRRKGGGHAALRRRLGLPGHAPRRGRARATALALASCRSTPARRPAVRGVRAVLTAADIPHNGILDEASGLGVDAIVQPVLAADRVRYDGEPVALVAAETPGAAAEAAGPGRGRVRGRAGACSTPRRRCATTRPSCTPAATGTSRGARRSATSTRPWRTADLVVEETYHSQRVDHAYLEPEAGIGWIDSDGVLTLRVSTQVIEHAREIAEILRAAPQPRRVIAAYMGGGFGGKEDMTVEPFIAALVWKTRRPVRMVWSRQESLLARQKRHPFRHALPHRASRTTGRSSPRTSGSSATPGHIRCSPPGCCSPAGVNSTGPYRMAERSGGEHCGVHQHGPDQRDARVRRHAGGVRLRVADGSRSPSGSGWTGPRSASATSCGAAISG